MFALPTLFSSLSFLLHYSIRSSVSRHLLHAQPCVCLCVYACGCVGVCVCLCASQYVCTQGKTAESNCTGPSADSGKSACILQTETVQTKNTQAQTNTHTHTQTQIHATSTSLKAFNLDPEQSAPFLWQLCGWH